MATTNVMDWQAVRERNEALAAANGAVKAETQAPKTSKPNKPEWVDVDISAFGDELAELVELQREAANAEREAKKACDAILIPALVEHSPIAGYLPRVSYKYDSVRVAFFPPSKPGKTRPPAIAPKPKA